MKLIYSGREGKGIFNIILAIHLFRIINAIDIRIQNQIVIQVSTIL